MADLDSYIVKDNHEAGKDADAAKHALTQAAFGTSDEKAPDSAAGRYGTWLADGIKDLPAGAWHSVQKDFGSWDGLKGTGEMVLSSAALGATLKMLLPEGGMAGKAASVLIGGYFLGKAAEPVAASFRNARDAQTMDQLHAAGAQLGDAAGDFVTGTIISGAGYKLGARGADIALRSERFDNFAAAKAKFWQPTESFLADHTPTWLSSRLITEEAIQRSRTLDLNTRSWSVQGKTATFMDSMKEQAAGESLGPVDPNAKVQLSVYAKSLDPTGIKLDRRLDRIAHGRAGFVTDAEMAAKFGADPKSVEAIKSWAQSKGLNAELVDARTSRMSVSGTAAQVEGLLGTKLETWKSPDGVVHRARSGALKIDSGVAPHIDAILGADNRPSVLSNRTPFVPIEETQLGGNLKSGAVGPEFEAEAGKGGAVSGARPKPIMANELAEARGLKVDATTGSGKTIGIGELGGDVDLAQDATFYTKRGLPVPERIKKGVNGNVPRSDGPNGADGEVALDTNVAGLTAPGAKQVIAFGENSDAGFPDTHNEMAFPTDGAPAADVISWSWGQRQGDWTKQAQAALTNALKKSAAKGITTFVASGDTGAMDGAPRGKFDIDFPSASPYVTGVGGTLVTMSGGKVVNEVSWNDGRDSSTGGGISSETPRPDFQKGLNMPSNANGGTFDGRGVPDVAENASPRSGYVVQVDGHEGSIGGTSGAAPQWAAYTAALASKVGRNFGNINHFLYRNGTAGIFNDITSGDNYGYKSGSGWDAVTGWGSPKLGPMLDALKNDATGQAKVRPFMVPVNEQQSSDNNRKSG
jgi:kumamolisin